MRCPDCSGHLFRQLSSALWFNLRFKRPRRPPLYFTIRRDGVLRTGAILRELEPTCELALEPLSRNMDDWADVERSRREDWLALQSLGHA